MYVVCNKVQCIYYIKPMKDYKYSIEWIGTEITLWSEKAYTQFQTLQKESSKLNILNLNVMEI